MANEVALVLPLSVDPYTGGLVTTTDQGVIWSNRVRIALETTIGERIMRPEYGTKIAAQLFNTVTGMEDVVRKEVSRIFVESFPTLEFLGVETSHDPRENLITMDVRFGLPNKTQKTVRAGVITVSANGPSFEETL